MPETDRCQQIQKVHDTHELTDVKKFYQIFPDPQIEKIGAVKIAFHAILSEIAKSRLVTKSKND